MDRKQRHPNETTSQYLLVQPAQIHFLCCLLEAYEGLSTVTTLDPKLGLVRVSVAPGCEQDVKAILYAERCRLGLVFIEPENDFGDRGIDMDNCGQSILHPR